jgi:hypothetical protein
VVVGHHQKCGRTRGGKFRCHSCCHRFRPKLADVPPCKLTRIAWRILYIWSQWQGVKGQSMTCVILPKLLAVPSRILCIWSQSGRGLEAYSSTTTTTRSRRRQHSTTTLQQHQPTATSTSSPTNHTPSLQSIQPNGEDTEHRASKAASLAMRHPRPTTTTRPL